MPDEGWNRWSKHVLMELERLNTAIEKIDDKLDVVSKDIIMLKIKAGVWGAMAGAIPVLIGLALVLLKKVG